MKNVIVINVFSYEDDSALAVDTHSKRIEFKGTYEEAKEVLAKLVKEGEDKQKENLPY